MRFGSKILSIGTGVLYERHGKYFIVTAWHNVTGLHSETLKHLSEKKAVPDNVVVSLAVVFQGMGTQRFSFILPLIDEEKALFYIHPVNWPRVDVVTIPFDPAEDQLAEFHLPSGEVKKAKISLLNGVNGGCNELSPIQNFLAAGKKIIDQWLSVVAVTEQLYIPGYPQNIQDQYQQPVWKRATVASSVQQGWNGERKFLIDTASQSGMSGAPVLHYSPRGVIRILGMTYYMNPDTAILAGIYVGRIGVTADADPQIGVVWHSSVIDEIIDGECFERLPEEIEVSPRELEAAVNDVLSHCSRTGLENVNNPDMPSRFYVQSSILKQLGGRVSPERALEEILDVAKNYDGPLVPDEEQ